VLPREDGGDGADVEAGPEALLEVDHRVVELVSLGRGK
jgi:hypothetical protein